MGKIITLQKNVREGECRGLEKTVRGRENSQMVKATQNYHYINIQVIFIIIITRNRL